MNLWIESQDKEFLGIFKKFQQCHAEILGYDETWEDDTKVVLGEYASPERAKEVMDEIKKELIIPAMEDGINLYPNNVFEMPQE
nr:MAG TPA: hypothetical protein [Caudoviricetes sp.]